MRLITRLFLAALVSLQIPHVRDGLAYALLPTSCVVKNDWGVFPVYLPFSYIGIGKQAEIRNLLVKWYGWRPSLTAEKVTVRLSGEANGSSASPPSVSWLYAIGSLRIDELTLYQNDAMIAQYALSYQHDQFLQLTRLMEEGWLPQQLCVEGTFSRGRYRIEHPLYHGKGTYYTEGPWIHTTTDMTLVPDQTLHIEKSFNWEKLEIPALEFHSPHLDWKGKGTYENGKLRLFNPDSRFTLDMEDGRFSGTASYADWPAMKYQGTIKEGRVTFQGRTDHDQVDAYYDGKKQVAEVNAKITHNPWGTLRALTLQARLAKGKWHGKGNIDGLGYGMVEVPKAAFSFTPQTISWSSPALRLQKQELKKVSGQVNFAHWDRIPWALRSDQFDLQGRYEDRKLYVQGGSIGGVPITQPTEIFPVVRTLDIRKKALASP